MFRQVPQQQKAVKNDIKKNLYSLLAYLAEKLALFSLFYNSQCILNDIFRVEYIDLLTLFISCHLNPLQICDGTRD